MDVTAWISKSGEKANFRRRTGHQGNSEAAKPSLSLFPMMLLKIRLKNYRINALFTVFLFDIVDTREQLGHAIGKDARVVVAILDEGFAKKLLRCSMNNTGVNI